MQHILFLTQGREDLPSVRFRVIPYLKKGIERGFAMEWRRIPKHPFQRMLLFLRLPASRIIILQKKLLSPFFFSLLKRKCRHVYYDFDDAVWTSHSAVLMEKKEGYVGRKNWNRFKYICRNSQGVIAGNSFLARKAKRYSRDVFILPTPIDTDAYLPLETSREVDGFVVGWMGTAANQFYLADCMAELSALGGDFSIQIISNKLHDALDGYPVQFQPWSSEGEVRQLNGFSVGLMPLTDDEYSRGKCGFKLLQYMSCGVVPLASEVGFNTEIITHAKDGFFIRNPGDWKKYVTLLQNDRSLRRRMSFQAREKVKSRFSLETASSALWRKLKVDDPVG